MLAALAELLPTLVGGAGLPASPLTGAVLAGTMISWRATSPAELPGCTGPVLPLRAVSLDCVFQSRGDGIDLRPPLRGVDLGSLVTSGFVGSVGLLATDGEGFCLADRVGSSNVVVVVGFLPSSTTSTWAG